MCLLIVQKNNAKVSNKNLKNAWERNNDGVGYSFVKDGKIVTRKYMQFKPFKTSFNNDVKYTYDSISHRRQRLYWSQLAAPSSRLGISFVD